MLAAAGIGAGLIPGGKVGLKGLTRIAGAAVRSADEVADVARGAARAAGSVDNAAAAGKNAIQQAQSSTVGRSGAFGGAKRDAGIPQSQQPDSVSRIPMTDRNGKAILGSDGKPIMTREYTFTRPDGSKVVIQDHTAGHNFGGVRDQDPHFNVRPPENTRTGKVLGTQSHYPFDR